MLHVKPMQSTADVLTESLESKPPKWSKDIAEREVRPYWPATQRMISAELWNVQMTNSVGQET